ncbi:MAG TPA: phosphate ABC transporter permease PstA [Blastocatellia bacterium]|nr:phosphate ABC transporter permease PstA [Blastocatellia bacterium]
MKRIPFLKSGEPYIWLTGGALAFCVLMVAGMVLLIAFNGLSGFWPTRLVRFAMNDGRVILGRVEDRDLSADPSEGKKYRIKVNRGNRDLDQADFIWLEESDVAEHDQPSDALVVERTEWGSFFGQIKALKDGDHLVAEGPSEGLSAVIAALPETHRLQRQIVGIEKKEIGDINEAQEHLRLRSTRLERQGVTSGPELDRVRAEKDELQRRYDGQTARLEDLKQQLQRTVVLSAVDGTEKEIPLANIVRLYQPNRMGLMAKAGLYLSKIWEFVSDDPRESNTEGGTFPAIFGTVMMVMLMTFIVTPLGVVAAVYLREYARQGRLVSAVRIAVNNLAGVPSIVFGVFGVGFFIYLIGGNLDRLFFADYLPTPTLGTGGILWASLTLALLTLPVVIVATEEGLAAVPRDVREASLALGATQFETTWRVVLPAVTPSILTGLILAMARAAGEVAPLMVTGVVKLAPTLPIDGNWPYLHVDRKFMHLGFYIYDVGFQSPNVDAARPMVFATTLLLLVIVIVLNLAAILLRNHLRRRLTATGF